MYVYIYSTIIIMSVQHHECAKLVHMTEQAREFRVHTHIHNVHCVHVNTFKGQLYANFAIEYAYVS